LNDAVFWLYHGISTSGGATRVDPIRIVEGVAGGTGFLGAGTIIQSRGSVKGMTTSATIWVVGAIGVACGLGQHLVAVMLTSYGWIILRVFGLVQHRIGLKQTKDGDCDDSRSSGSRDD
jgi:putative Mg2+ transporter-C (MgtC) family protein